MSYLYSILYHPYVSLSMNDCDLGDDGGSALGEGLSRNLTLRHLSLRDNNLNYYTAKIFADSLSRQKTNIEYLDLSHNKLDNKGAEELAKALLYNNSLINLNLSYNLIENNIG